MEMFCTNFFSNYYLHLWFLFSLLLMATNQLAMEEDEVVNVNDISEDTIPEVTSAKDRLALVFDRQAELMAKYHEIEKQNGLLQTEMLPVDLHDRYGQARLKDFAWRVTEELAEATESDPGSTHFFEELSDAYHFLVELCLHTGFTDVELWQYFVRQIEAGEYRPTAMPSHSECRMVLMFGSVARQTPRYNQVRIYGVIEAMGWAMNCLKQKPWKNTHLLTDVDKYHSYIGMANLRFFHLCCSLDITADDLFRMYHLKSEVNAFRQRTNY